jgi:hypothetical protein
MFSNSNQIFWSKLEDNENYKKFAGILRDSRPALRIFSPTPSRSRGIPTGSPGLPHCGIPFWGSSWNRRAYLGIGLQNNSYHEAYHPSRIHRNCPGLELTAPVADEILTGTLSVPVYEFSKKREKMSEKNLILKLN